MKERSTRCPPKLRILSALLAFAMLLTLLPVTAFAADEYRTIDDVQYVKRDGAIIWRVKSYSGSKSDLTLESKINGANVQIIDREAFKGNTTLTHVKLPQGLFMDIYDEAFAGCTNLASLDIPVTLSAIGQKAFQNCTSLKTFTLGGETEEDILNWGKVAVSAFEGCSSLESFTMNAISGRFQDYAFRNCIALKEVTITKNINEFGTGVFDGCTSLTKIIYNGKPTDWANCPAKGKIPANVKVEFAVPLTEYKISVCGIKANEANYADMLGDKKVEFVPTSNYLILNNANVSYDDATTAAIDSTLDNLVIAGNGKDTIENISGPGIKTTGELVLRSSHIIVKGTPAISAQSIVVRDDDYWYRTAADGTFVKSTGTVAIGNAKYFELIESQYDPNDPNGIFLWINDKRMPEIYEGKSYDVFGNGTALLEEKVDDLSGGMHCTLYLKDANLESADTAIQTMVEQLTIIGTGTIKGGKNSLFANRENDYSTDDKVRIEKSNLTFTGGLYLYDGTEIVNSTVTVNGWTDYGIKASSPLIIDGSDVTITSETGEYALCPWRVKVKENSTLRLQGAKSIVNGGYQMCIVNAENYWYRTSPDAEYTKGTEKEFLLDRNYHYYELTTIDPYAVKTYDLWVAGKQVTETNQNDVLGDGGSVKFDPDTNKLTLKDANLTLDGAANVNGCIDSELAEELTITGTATLSNADGILTDGPLTLKNADLTLTGNNEDGGEEAIRAGRSDEDITIQNSKVTIAGTNAEGSFFHFGIRCGKLTVANSTLDVKTYGGSAIEADTMEVSGTDTVVMAETDSTDEDDYALALDDETSLTLHDGLALVAGKVNESKTAKIAQPEQAPTDFKAYWVVRPGDKAEPSMQIPSAITGSEEEERLFEGWFLEDGTRLEDSPYYMGPGADHVGNLDRDVTFYGHWRTAESGEGSGDGGDGFGTLLAGVAVVGVAGVVAYQVGTELILDQLLPAGVAVPHTRAELAMLLWNTAGRPAPAALPAFADVADPELAQAAQWAIEQGYLKARADGSFKPDKGVAKWRVIRGYRAVTEP